MGGPAGLSDDDLVAHALAVHVLSGDDTEVYDACVAELQRRGSVVIRDRALGLLADERAEARALGADVLAQLGKAAGTLHLEASVGPLLALAAVEADPLVLDSVVGALGHLGDQRALAVVLAASGNPSYRVRSAAAKALPELADLGFLDEDHPIVTALITLTADEEHEVRNWATFGLGALVRVDGSRTRAVLAGILDDPDDDTRAEALAGLARRRDPAVIAAVAAGLEAGEVGRLGVSAAALLSSSVLLAGLQGLVGWWDVDESLLVTALRNCDPVAQTAEIAVLAQLVEAGAVYAPGTHLVVESELLPVDDGRPMIRFDGDGSVPPTSVEALLTAAEGSPRRAVEILLASGSVR